MNISVEACVCMYVVSEWSLCVVVYLWLQVT